MPTVLVVEADDANAKLQRVLLEEENWFVVHVPTADHAVGVLQSLRADLILLGLGSVGALLSIPQLEVAASKTPIIVVSSLHDYRAEDRALRLGCIGVIRKPIDVTTFADQLSTFLVHR